MCVCVCFLQEVTIRGGGLKHVACAEDEDFIQALDKMMLENLQVQTTTIQGYSLTELLGSISYLPRRLGL